jgi:CheY-like chemotaxis protein
MILAVVDDIFFRSKIRTTAKGTGADVTFARSDAEVLEQARSARPSLIILDLNGQKVDPIAVLGALKQDPATASVPTLGFVSHVQTNLIDAARAAGCDTVMARSAFAANLADILTGGRPA